MPLDWSRRSDRFLRCLSPLARSLPPLRRPDDPSLALALALPLLTPYTPYTPHPCPFRPITMAKGKKDNKKEAAAAPEKPAPSAKPAAEAKPADEKNKKGTGGKKK